MKSVISNTSDSGCGERAGEAVSGEAAAAPAGSAGQERGDTYFAVRRHLAPLPGQPRRARRLTGKRRRAVRAVPLRGRSSSSHRLGWPGSLAALLPVAAAEPPPPPGALPRRPP